MGTTVTYKGSTLTTVNNQTRTLKTAGKYMEGDVTLTDTSPSIVVSETLDANGGIIKTITTTDEVNLQTKTITPTSSVQTVNPDTGYDGFSQVIVNAGGGGGNSGYVWQDQYGYVHLSDEPGTQITVDPLSVTANGTYTATTGHAYSPVTVSVSGSIPIFSVEWNASFTVAESITCNMTFNECINLIQRNNAVVVGAIENIYYGSETYTSALNGGDDIVDGQLALIYYNYVNLEHSILYRSNGTLSIVDGNDY